MGVYILVIACFAVPSIILLAGLSVADTLHMRRMSALDFAPVTMDGATCVKTKDNRILIRPRKLFNWLVITFLGTCEFGLLAVLVNGVITVPDSLMVTAQIINLSIGITVIGAALLATIYFSRRPLIFLDLNARLLAVVDGPHTRQIPFSSVVGVDASSLTDTPSEGVVRSSIQVVLRDGETIEIGSVSGKEPRVRTAANAIVELISSATDAKPLLVSA